ncbi:hypothetical protein [Neisseria polysaccharea]|nr:hypothetical protein [Neisseria polysaccharea]
MPSESSDGIFISARLLVRLIILYNAPHSCKQNGKNLPRPRDM